MFKVNGFVYISNDELRRITKLDPKRLQRLQKNYGEFRDIEKYRLTNYVNSKGQKVVVRPHITIGNRETRRRQEFHSPWKNGKQKNNAEHRTKHKSY